MGNSSNLNFENVMTGMLSEGGSSSGSRPPGDFPLARQTSIYSLTFDKFQNTIGSIGREYRSMNMDELLKSIWNAEENQIHNSNSNNNNNNNNNNSNSGGDFHEGDGYNLPRQGTVTLPRTLSQKTVDEVWQNMVKEYEKEHGAGYSEVPAHGQPTLGGVTLEEFLVRAGLVKEEPQKPKTGRLFMEPPQPANNSVPNLVPVGVGLAENVTNHIARYDGKQTTAQLVQTQPKLQEIIPKLPVPGYNHSSRNNPSIRGGIVAMQDNGGANDSPVQKVALHSFVGNEVANSSGGKMAPVFPLPYALNGGVRGRKAAAMEKVVERRQRRMIKNRESAARSRARKQAYTTELEAEAAQLKKENELLQKKQAEMLEMQKNRALEMMKQQNGNKRRCLRRTQTGLW